MVNATDAENKHMFLWHLIEMCYNTVLFSQKLKKRILKILS